MNEDHRKPYNGLIVLREVSKIYQRGEQVVVALDGIDLEVPERGMVAIAGASGSGKSSLLHIIGAMDRASSGEVFVAGQRLDTLPAAALTAFRRNTVGFVFQSFNLIPNLSAIENVMLPMEFAGVAPEERKQRAGALLEQVGLAARVTHWPRELSGGEQQRVAIARALANNPPLILADEPTGNLDSQTAQQVGQLLLDLHGQEKTMLLTVTHSADLAAIFPRRLNMLDGTLANLSEGGS